MPQTDITSLIIHEYITRTDPSERSKFANLIRDTVDLLEQSQYESSLEDLIKHTKE